MVPEYADKCKYCDFRFQNAPGKANPKKTVQWYVYAGIILVGLAVVVFAFILPGANKSGAPVATEYDGLGASIDVWDRAHKPDGLDAGGYHLYDNKRFALNDIDGKVNYMEIIWGDDAARNFEDAKALALQYIPSDSQLEETYSPREYRVVERYTSASLAPLFDDASWYGSPPGVFIIIYRKYDFGVSSVVLALGNNP